MLHSMKEISIKNRPYHFFNDMINIKNVDPSLLGINEMSCKNANISIYHIEYMTMNIYSENTVYLIFNNVDGYIIEESNKDKYLSFASTNKNKKVLKKYRKLWDETKNQIETINGGEPIKYKRDFMKIKFESGDDLTLGKILSIPNMICFSKRRRILSISLFT